MSSEFVPRLSPGPVGIKMAVIGNHDVIRDAIRDVISRPGRVSRHAFSNFSPSRFEYRNICAAFREVKRDDMASTDITKVSSDRELGD